MKNGKVLSAEVKHLSREDGLPWLASDFKKGALVVVDVKGKAVHVCLGQSIIFWYKN